MDIVYIVVFCVVVLMTYLMKRRDVGKTWSNSAVVHIEEKELKCSHCGNNQFSKREGLLGTKWVNMFWLNFWNQSARCFVCQNCGFLHWFVRTDEQVK